jgi:hypothetical protein
MMTDLWAHHFFENQKEAEEFEDDDFDMDAELAAIEAEAESDPSEDLPVSDEDADWEDLT